MTPHTATTRTILPWASATDLLAGIRRRDISSAELLEHYLDRIDRLNPAINAVITLDVDRARERAAAARAMFLADKRPHPRLRAPLRSRTHPPPHRRHRAQATRHRR
jgi:amidase